MKVWIINQTATPPSLGGLVRHYYFAKYMRQDKHDVRIITSSKIHNTDTNFINDKTLYIEKDTDEIEYTFVKTCDYVTNGIKRIYSMLQFAHNAKKTCDELISKENKPDIIYASSPSPFSAFIAIRFARANNIEAVLEIRDLWPASIVAYSNISEKNLGIKLLYKLEKWMYKNADKIIFTFQGGKDYICNKGWDKEISLDKIYSVNNGVDLEEFKYNQENYIYEDEDLDNDKIFKAIYMGSIRQAYNISALIEAAKILSEKGDNIKILIFGDGNEKDKLEDRIKEYGLDNIAFKGKVEKKYIASILSRSNLNIVNVAHSESLSKYGSSWNKLFEYMASGKPILSNNPVNYDLIKEYNFGISKAMDTPEEYAQSILFVSEMPKENYEKMCYNALSEVEKFDYKNLIKQVEEILAKE